MAENTKKDVAAEPAKDNYKLHSDAVDDLVHAHTGRTTAYSEEELRKYRTHKGIHLAEWLKVILLKWWFSGVVCFFFIWGLGTYLSATLDLLFITGVALGLVMDLLLNNLLHFMEEKPGQNDRWMMFPSKKWVYLFLNILYSSLILYCVYSVYTEVNAAAAAASGDATSVALGVEPIIFGILYTAFDLLFVGIKNLVMKVFQEAKAKVDREMRSGKNA